MSYDPEELGTIDPSSPHNQPMGMRFPEHAFRKLIIYALQQLREHIDDTKNNVIDELFRMAGVKVIAEFKSWLRDSKNIFVDVNWPAEDLNLPCIGIFNQGEREDVASDVLGDVLGHVEYALDGGVVSRETNLVAMQVTTHIYIGTSQPNLTLYLYNLVRFILLKNKSQLTEWYDIHNLTMNGQAVEYDERLMPTLGYYRLLQLQYLTYFDYNLSEEATQVLCVNLQVDTDRADPVIVPYT
jgi:hypothetical protein